VAEVDDDAFGEFLSGVPDQTISLQSSVPSVAASSSAEADFHVPDSHHNDSGAAAAKQKQAGENIHHITVLLLLLWCSLGLADCSLSLHFLNKVGGRSATDPRETSFLWQRISVLIQRFNAILISKTFFCPNEAPDL